MLRYWSPVGQIALVRTRHHQKCVMTAKIDTCSYIFFRAIFFPAWRFSRKISCENLLTEFSKHSVRKNFPQNILCFFFRLPFFRALIWDRFTFFRNFPPKSQNILCFFPDFKIFLPNAQKSKSSCEIFRQSDRKKNTQINGPHRVRSPSNPHQIECDLRRWAG